MTLVNTETGELLDVETAERRASYICTDLDHIAESFETAMERMREAIAERDDITLGYRSPGDYIADRFGGRLARLGVDLRREVVRELTEAGLSTRAIAPVVDVSQKTVVKDRQAGDTRGITSESPEGGSFPAAATTPAPVDEGAPEAAPARHPVVGIDGKTYARTAATDRLGIALAEFPDLSYYAESGRPNDVVNMAGDLRIARQRGELDERLDTLRRSIAIDRSKRDGTYRPGTTAVMGDDGEYRMAPMPTPTPSTTRTCPTCSGRGVIEE